MIRYYQVHTDLFTSINMRGTGRQLVKKQKYNSTHLSVENTMSNNPQVI